MEYIKIGQIINTFGIKGELKVESYSDFESERYKKGSTVYLTDEHIPVVVNYYKHHKGFTLVQFKDLENINFVEKYKNQPIYKAKEDIKPLEKGHYYFSDLENLDVMVDGVKQGIVKQVEEGISSNYLRVLKNDGKEVLVAYLPVFIKKVDLENRTIELVKMEGLL